MQTQSKKYNYDLTQVKRNTYISEKNINNILGSNHRDKYYGLAKLAFIEWLQKQVDTMIIDGELDEQLIVKQEDWGIIFLGGIDAVRYCNKRVDTHIKNAKKQNKKLFSVSPNDIDHHQLDEYNHYIKEAKIKDSILNRTSKTYC